MWSSTTTLCVSSLLLVLILCVSGVSSYTNPTIIGKGYRLISIEETPDGGILGHLQLKQKSNTYGPDIPLLQLFVKYVRNTLENNPMRRVSMALQCTSLTLTVGFF